MVPMVTLKQSNNREGRAPRVLLAEDDESSRKLLARALRALGLEVEESSDGGRLLVSVASQYNDDRTPADVDLIVTDIRMPVCSGLDIFKGVRAAHWTAPVILMTAYDTPEVEAAAEKLGATLLIKPLDLALFEQKVMGLLSRPRPPPSAPGRRPAGAPRRSGSGT